MNQKRPLQRRQLAGTPARLASRSSAESSDRSASRRRSSSSRRLLREISRFARYDSTRSSEPRRLLKEIRRWLEARVEATVYFFKLLLLTFDIIDMIAIQIGQECSEQRPNSVVKMNPTL